MRLTLARPSARPSVTPLVGAWRRALAGTLALSLALSAGAAPAQTRSVESRVPESRAEIALSFAPLVREAAPAVVNIYARRVVEARRSRLPMIPSSASSFAISPSASRGCRIRSAPA